MDNGHTIYHDFVIKAPINKVFESITSPSHLINWWPLRCSGVPRTGEEYNFYFSPEFDWYGKVVNVVSPNTFHVKMTKSDADWNLTSFGFDLEENENTVQVRFCHKGWPECNAHFRRSSYCWAILLSGLKNYVEQGVIVPFTERE